MENSSFSHLRNVCCCGVVAREIINALTMQIYSHFVSSLSHTKPRRRHQHTQPRGNCALYVMRCALLWTQERVMENVKRVEKRRVPNRQWYCQKYLDAGAGTANGRQKRERERARFGKMYKTPKHTHSARLYSRKCWKLKGDKSTAVVCVGKIGGYVKCIFHHWQLGNLWGKCRFAAF